MHNYFPLLETCSFLGSRLLGFNRCTSPDQRLMRNRMANQAYQMALVTQDSLDSYIRSANSLQCWRLKERGLAERLHYKVESTLRRLDRFHTYDSWCTLQGVTLATGCLWLISFKKVTSGLMKAVKRFNPEVGVRLVSFAVHWIKRWIHEYVLRNWRIVKIATTKAQRKLFFNLRKSKKAFRLVWQ